MRYQVGDYEIVGYEPRYREQVIDLMTPLWGPDKDLKAACLDWKHFTNPYARNPFIHIALYRERVAAVRPLWPYRWEGGQAGEKYQCIADVDTVVHPDHRGQGLFKEMISIALKELETDVYDFDITLSGGNPFSVAGNLKLGYASVGDLRMMHRKEGQAQPKDSWLHSTARKVPFLPEIYGHFRKSLTSQQREQDLPRPFDILDANYIQTGHFNKSDVVLEKKPRPDAMAMLVKRQGNDGRIRQVRDREFYAWRYQNPLSVYRFLFWEKGGLEGYLVLQQDSRANWQAACIVDWEVTGAEVFSDLLHTAIIWGGFTSISIWSVTLADDLIKTLVNHGFSDVRENGSLEAGSFWPPILVKSLHPGANLSMGGRDLLNISNWDLRPIYSDSY